MRHWLVLTQGLDALPQFLEVVHERPEPGAPAHDLLGFAERGPCARHISHGEVAPHKFQACLHRVKRHAVAQVGLQALCLRKDQVRAFHVAALKTDPRGRHIDEGADPGVVEASRVNDLASRLRQALGVARPSIAQRQQRALGPPDALFRRAAPVVGDVDRFGKERVRSLMLLRDEAEHPENQESEVVLSIIG